MMAEQFCAYLQRVLHTRGVSVDLRRPYETVEAHQRPSESTRDSPKRASDGQTRLQEVTDRLEVLGFEMRHSPDSNRAKSPVLTWLWDGEPAVVTGPISKEVAELAQEWTDLDACLTTAHNKVGEDGPSDAQSRADHEHDPTI
jgi:hypothetical protein